MVSGLVPVVTGNVVLVVGELGGREVDDDPIGFVVLVVVVCWREVVVGWFDPGVVGAGPLGPPEPPGELEPDAEEEDGPGGCPKDGVAPPNVGWDCPPLGDDCSGDGG